MELAASDSWSLYTRVMDQQSAADWINLGRLMLMAALAQPAAADRAKERAETAFRRALQIDAAVEIEIERVRDEVEQRRRAAAEARRLAEAEKLTTISPEGALWGAEAWPALSEDEQASAVLAMKADAERALKQASTGLTPVETAHFIVYAETERSEAADIAVRLERVFLALEFLLNPGIDPAATSKPVRMQPWGKVAVFIWNEQDRFRTVEAETFRHLVPGAAVGVAHFRGPKAFINCWREPDDETFDWAIIRETVHALMHSCQSPKRLPPWANEGLAELIASKANKHSHIGRDRRVKALEFIRAGGSIDAILNLKYEDSSWSGAGDVGPAAGGLLVELMLNQKPARLAQWIMSVKAGKDWATALQEDYGVSREEFVAVSTQFLKVND
jgi:hypothetical protein